MKNHNAIFNITSEKDFNSLALAVFQYQYKNNIVYNNFCNLLNVNPNKITSIKKIPFLPISFFKTHIVKTGDFEEEIVFLSSGTTGETPSKHFVKDVKLYEKSFSKCFEQFYGTPSNVCILALLPSYLERDGSSLIYMADALIKASNHPKSGFYLHNLDELVEQLNQLEASSQPTLLIGVSFALLGLSEKYTLNLTNTIVMETGGMKGKRKELTRDELHILFMHKFGVKTIHSEYGMTELLSQAYSNGNGIYTPPNWMKILIRDVNDPFNLLPNQQTGGINIIDLANIDSCAFIATQDLGKSINNNQFEVLGRFDNSDLRGCNLLIT